MKKIFAIGFLSVAILLVTNFTTVAQTTPATSPPLVIISITPPVSPSTLGENTATLVGRVTSIGSSPLTKWGFDFGPDITPMTYPRSATSTPPSVSNPYSIAVGSLNCNTVYRYRAFAINGAGRSNSASKTFTTSPCPTSNIKSLNGWAWSSNIGWVSFNCANVDGTCDDSDYKVEIDLTTGLLTGYAWSSNIGWIKFGGLSGYPTSGTAAVPAKINMTNGNGEGWARACAGTVNGTCEAVGTLGSPGYISAMESRTDGWDGWIELAGTNHNPAAIPTPTPSPAGYTGVRMNTTTGSITGMAWGSNVVGWLNFNASTDITSNFIASCAATNIGTNIIRFTANATGGSSLYEYKWDTSTSFVSLNTYDKTYSPGTTATIGASLIVKKISTGQTNSVSCVGSPAPVPPVTITKCSITSPVAGSDGVVSIYEKESVSFKVENPQPVGLTFGFLYNPGTGAISPAKTTQTYTHIYPSPMTLRQTYAQVIDRDSIYPSSAQYPCGEVEVKGRGLELKVAPDGTNAFTNELTIKKGRNVSLMWKNSLNQESNKPPYYTCQQNVQSTESWDLFRDADITTDDQISGLSTQKTGKHVFKISCEHNSLDPALVMNAQAILNVVSTSGSEI